MSIHKACKVFKNTGHFVLEGAELNLKTLGKLRDKIKKIRDNLQAASQADYQLQLKTIGFTIESESQPVVLKGFSSPPYLRIVEKFETILLEILTLGWRVIHLDQLTFSREKKDYCLSSLFYESLFEQLTEQHHTLHELSIELNRTNITLLSDFVSHAADLKTLRLDMRSLTAGDITYFHVLASTLARCLQLQLLEFKNPPQTNDYFYEALNKILDEHYQLELITPEPQTESMENAIQCRIARRSYLELRERLKNSNSERFKREQLTQNKLLRLLTDDLMTPQQNLFNALVASSPLKTISDAHWLDGITTLLPPIFRNNIDYVRQHAADLRLDLQKPLLAYPNRTVGAYLLTTAYKADKVGALKCLIAADSMILHQVYDFEKIGCMLLKRAFDEDNIAMFEAILAADKTLLEELYQPDDPFKIIGHALLEKALCRYRKAKVQLTTLYNADSDLFEGLDESALTVPLRIELQNVKEALRRETENHAQDNAAAALLQAKMQTQTKDHEMQPERQVTKLFSSSSKSMKSEKPSSIGSEADNNSTKSLRFAS